jgi:uracil-DNA glycosylase family 4
MYRQAITALMEFYESAGVDCALGDAPIDRYAEAAAAEQAKAETPSRTALPPARAAAPASAPAVQVQAQDAEIASSLADAERLAGNAQTLEALREALESFEGCALKKTARRLVFADGNPEASIMLIGEAPGRDEDTQGLPFVGRSGQLLDRMLASIGLDRSKVYIGNVIYWRPPGNRTPTMDERAMCEPFIRRQIELAAPKLLMTLGGSALSTLFEGRQGIMKTRGQRLIYDPDGLAVPAIPTLHPAALLRNPAHKALAWRDLLALRLLMEELGLT